jgi:hypothetical protein
LKRLACAPCSQDFTRRLRQEQDAAYEASLAEDREREAARAAAREKQAAAERAAADAAAQARCGTLMSCDLCWCMRTPASAPRLLHAHALPLPCGTRAAVLRVLCCDAGSRPP